MQPDCPSWLLPEAVEFWGSIAPGLVADGLLTATEVPALAAYCQCYARWRRAESALGDQPLVGPDGKINAALKASDLLSKQLRAFAIEFGFTPSARGRIVLPPPATEETDSLAEFIG